MGRWHDHAWRASDNALVKIVERDAGGALLLVGELHCAGMAPRPDRAAALLAGLRMFGDRPVAEVADSVCCHAAAWPTPVSWLAFAMIGVLPDGRIEVVTAGGPEPLRLCGRQDLDVLEPTDITAPVLPWEPETVPRRSVLAPAERLLLCTDGVLAARDRLGTVFRLADHLDVLAHPDLQEAVDGLWNRLRRHIGGPPPGDAAVFLAQRRSSASPPAKTSSTEHDLSRFPVS
ncbi:hypothetical protein BBK14_27705 [Parafrankia soli]|uniref:PPM-type phosphatase domain-containing protein n=1 Tax=Parafrankia soli TaxID=2599596 RepID=A0A1S1PGY8_9ACTN|nr:hypothetical protein BBK14_27705 [Parafrankia soli]